MANPNPSPATRFKPGNRVNPGGKPRGLSITAELRALLESTDFKGKANPEGKTIRRLIAEKVVEQALAGEFKFIAEYLDRTEGRTPVNVVTVAENPNVEKVRDRLSLPAPEPLAIIDASRTADEPDRSIKPAAGPRSPRKPR